LDTGIVDQLLMVCVQRQRSPHTGNSSDQARWLVILK
jgi:hypothetical protein